MRLARPGADLAQRARRRRLVRVLELAVVLLVIATGARVLVGLATVGSRDEQRRYPLSGGRLVIEVRGGGALRVTPGPAGVVEVDRHLSYAPPAPRASQSLEGDRLRLRLDCGNVQLVRCEARYAVRVPSTVSLRVDAPSSGLRVEGIAGDLDLAAEKVTLDGASGQVRLRAPSGTIDATGLRSADVEASAGQAVRLGFATAPRRVVARAGDAQAAVTVPAGSGPYRVEARSEPGRTTVAVRSDPAASSTITASSDNGHVVVREA
jgi:hypothetical protein